jgi:HEAT repeat protein
VSADTALLRALLWATAPTPDEVRAIAIEDLALLGDARALDPLSTLLWDPSPRVRAAAVRAIALFQHPRAEELLGDVVRHALQSEAVKLQALGGLLFQRTATARALLQDVARNPRHPPTVQSTALALEQRWDAPPSTPESTK